MRKRKLTTPQLGFIIVTRAAIGMGIGLLASLRLKEKQRKIVGGSLLAVGAATTIPALRMVLKA
jgi:hypothetical protein